MKDILREIGMITRCFESMANIEFKDYKLGKNQYIYLVRIAENPGIILEHLADMIKVDRSTASRAVKSLEENAFIKKEDTAGTGKKIKIYTTNKGDLAYKMLKNDEDYSNIKALDGFNHDELANLLGYLRRIRLNIEPDWLMVKKGKERPYRKAKLSDDGTIIDEEIKVIDYEDSHIGEFRAISYEWLVKYVSVEPADEVVLNAPRKEIIDRGGCILMAEQNGHIVGTIALIKVDDKTYEIAKFGVKETAQNNGVGKRLMIATLMKAHDLDATKVILYTTHRLKAALHLYESFGFKEVKGVNQKYEEAELMMELNFK